MHIEELPLHGGDLHWAAQQFGIARDDWLDVSTGISPWRWPITKLSSNALQRLPYDHEPLLRAASHYYQVPLQSLLAIPGSQFAIDQIPRCVPLGTVAVPELGYKAHESSWKHAGHELIYYKDLDCLQSLVYHHQLCYAVVINPNNPSGEYASREFLHKLESQLAKNAHNQHILVIDEAFMDTENQPSAAAYLSSTANTLVLRSLGKFFGLAGIRLGFLIAQPKWLESIRARGSMWQVSGPALEIGCQALSDSLWIREQKKRIDNQSKKVSKTLTRLFPKERHQSVGLFHSVMGNPTTLLNSFSQLAERGLLTRYIPHTPEQACLRFGLPGDDYDTFERKLQL